MHGVFIHVGLGDLMYELFIHNGVVPPKNPILGTQRTNKKVKGILQIFEKKHTTSNKQPKSKQKASKQQTKSEHKASKR